MSNELVIDKQRFDKDGYLLIKNVFSAQEIEQFREDAYKQYEIDQQKKLDFQLPDLATKAKYAKGDLLSKELLHHALLDDRILTIARTILGSEDIVYFGDSSYQIGTGLRGFHRDNIDRTDMTAPDWQGEYTLVRLGIYLQDHKNYSGGLKVKQGSHKNADGKPVFIDNEVGDVVIWDLKTIHSGNAVRLKLFPNFSINTSGKENLVPSFLKKEQQQERISMFMTFALKSSHLDRYINEYTLKRKDTLEHVKASNYNPEQLSLAKQKNVEVLKLLSEQKA
jgi:ectoine hydroxylase-related dioxygenase (phytanoyl-CoA dioxygenase family)